MFRYPAVAITLFLATGCEHAQVFEAPPAAPVAEVAPAPAPAPAPAVSAEKFQVRTDPNLELRDYRAMGTSRMGPRWDQEHRPRLKVKLPPPATVAVDGGVP